MNWVLALRLVARTRAEDVPEDLRDLLRDGAARGTVGGRRRAVDGGDGARGRHLRSEDLFTTRDVELRADGAPVHAALPGLSGGRGGRSANDDHRARHRARHARWRLCRGGAGSGAEADGQRVSRALVHPPPAPERRRAPSVSSSLPGQRAGVPPARDGLRDRGPSTDRVEGRASRRPGDEVVPADLRVDHVFLVSCKYLSKIVLNASPAYVFDRLLAGGHGARGGDWFREVAEPSLEQLYRQRRGAPRSPVPTTVG